MQLESEKAVLAQNQEAWFSFLKQPRNYERLMPESQVEKFELNDQDGFAFQLKGMPEIRLKRDKTEPNKKVIWGSASDKFQFSLTVVIDEIAADQAEVQFLFEGQFNSMMRMMVKKPLTRFLATLKENLSELE